MAILMHGSWHVQVTQKFASRDQRFIVAGASTGNGVHAGVVGTAISVTGSSWSLQLQNKNGTVWQNSTEKILISPSPCSGFTLASDDGGGTGSGDTDFNDLVLRCNTVASSGATDYVVYGHVSYYEGFCLLNPCWRDWLVLDSAASLRKALEYPELRDYIKKVYPERLIKTPRIPQPPNPPDPPFKPLMLPLLSDRLLPAREATLFKIEKQAADDSKRKSKDEPTPDKMNAVSSVLLNKTVNTTAALVDKVRLGRLVDKFPLSCNVQSYTSALLRFVEYDRSVAELAGGPYTGIGTREILGNIITDSFGNYVFRFQRSDYQDATELESDVASGESFVAQRKPDLLVQILDPTNVNRVMYESALYANINTCRRIDICIPKSAIGTTVNPCAGQSVIQYIGDIYLGQDASGNRGGLGYTLHNSGRISGNGLSCAGWRGKLNLISCRFTDPAIAYYTVRYRRSGISWTNVEEDMWLLNVSSGSPVNTSVRTTQNLSVDGAPLAPTRCYFNVEAPPPTLPQPAGWITSINYKAFLHTGNYTGISGRGRVEFRIEGYKADGTKIPAIDETIALYLDNHLWTVELDEEISMDGTTLGNCALFTLPSNGAGGVVEDAPIEIKFQANQESGFMGAYSLSIGKGATGNINLVKAGNHLPSGWNTLPNTGTYADGGATVGRFYAFNSSSPTAACPVFNGTMDEAGADADGDFIRIKVKPSSAWLEPGQNFCAFRLRVDGHIRHTDGDTYWNHPFSSNEVLIGIERPS